MGGGPVDEDSACRPEERDVVCGINDSGDTVHSRYRPLPGTPDPVDPATLTIGHKLGWTDGTPELELAV